MEKLIVNFTPTGMIPTKKLTPHVPVTISEIVEQVHEAFETGITIVHLHARDEETGVPTYKATVYQKIFEGISKYCPELILCASLSGRNIKEFEKRSEPIELYPDMGSLTLSSLNFPKQASVNSPEVVQKLAQKMNDYGVKQELEAFDFGMVNYAYYLIRKSILKPPYYFNLLFNNIAGAQANMAQIGLMLKELPENAIWSLAGIGDAQLQVNTLAIAMGGGVRIGLEDNIYYDRNRTKLATNIDLLKRIHHLAGLFERPIMTAKELGESGFYNINRKRN